MRSGWIDGNGSIGETGKSFKKGPVGFASKTSTWLVAAINEFSVRQAG